MFSMKKMNEHLLDKAASLTVLLAAKSLNGQLQVFGHHSPRLSWNVTNLSLGVINRHFYWSMGCADYIQSLSESRQDICDGHNKYQLFWLQS